MSASLFLARTKQGHPTDPRFQWNIYFSERLIIAPLNDIRIKVRSHNQTNLRKHTVNQSGAKAKLIVFPRLAPVACFASSSDWFVRLLLFVLIGQIWFWFYDSHLETGLIYLNNQLLRFSLARRHNEAVSLENNYSHWLSLNLIIG